VVTGPPPRPRLAAGGPNQLDMVFTVLVALAAAATLIACTLVYVAVWVDARLAGTHPPVTYRETARLLAVALGGDPGPLAAATVMPWRAATLAAALTTAALAVGWETARRLAGWQAGRLHRTRTRQRHTAPVWATPRQLTGLLARPPRRPDKEPSAAGRLWLGSLAGKDVLAPASTSVIAIAPTRTGKTSRLVIPNLLRWDGPAVVTSVKRDVYDLTIDRRARFGDVRLFDPTGATGLPAVRWSPLQACGTYPDATRTASWLTDAAATHHRHDSARFWDTLATKLLAPLLYATAATGHTIHDATLWIDRAAYPHITALLEGLGDDDAAAAWHAITALPDDTRGSALATAMTIFRAFGSPRVRHATSPTLDEAADDVLHPDRLLEGNHTLYLIAPEYEQTELRPLYIALIQTIYRTAIDTTTNRLHGAPLNPPLLLMLDEAGNTAPLTALPKIAATGASQGITLMTIWQDRAQIRHLYHDAERTIIANHTSSIWLPGSHDLDTLKLLAELIGDHSFPATTTATTTNGTTTTHSTERIQLAPPAFLRTLTHGTAILLTTNLPPARITTHAYHHTPRWHHHIPDEQLARHNAMHTPNRQPQPRRPPPPQPPAPPPPATARLRCV
jgi:type IV secretion system protein VirD4